MLSGRTKAIMLSDQCGVYRGLLRRHVLHRIPRLRFDRADVALEAVQSSGDTSDVVKRCELLR
jgi:hypothetical protein